MAHEKRYEVLYCTNTPFLVSETFLRKTRDYLATIFDVCVVSTTQKVGEAQALRSHFLGIRDDSIFHRVGYFVLAMVCRKPRELVRMDFHQRRIRGYFKRHNITAHAAIIEYGTSANVFAPILKENNIPFIITFHGYDCSMYLGFRWYRSAIVALPNLPLLLLSLQITLEGGFN